MEKLKADYLHKMIEQIEKQNIEYYKTISNLTFLSMNIN